MNFKPLLDLSKKRILITNDDGIEACGIKLLEKILLTITPDVWVVAPKTEKSGASHAITSNKQKSMAGHTTSKAFSCRAEKIDARHYAVDGTPSDCIREALNVIMPKNYPDLIVSGINNGRNIADDITYSGTVGAAVEGLLYGIPSIAVSQLIDGAKVVHWELAEKYLAELIKKICRGTFSADTLININFPNVALKELKGIKICRHGSRRFIEGTPENKRLKPDSYITKKTKKNASYPPDNIEISHNITISALTINLSDERGLKELEKILA